MSNFVENKLEEAELMNLLSKLSDFKVRGALKDLKSTLDDKLVNQKPSKTEQREIEKLLEVIEQKIS